MRIVGLLPILGKLNKDHSTRARDFSSRPMQNHRSEIEITLSFTYFTTPRSLFHLFFRHRTMKDIIEGKYAEERQKRLRPEGNAQYVDLHSPDLQDLAKDPWADHEALAKTDGPLHDGDNIKFLITGAGHNGILFAARLIDAGFDPKDIVLVDVAGGYGGTWYWNRYPGLMCDVEGYCYLPLLEETGYIPKHKYSYGAEIRHNCNLIAARYKFQGMFCTKVDNYVWDDTKGCWMVNLTQSLGHQQNSL